MRVTVTFRKLTGDKEHVPIVAVEVLKAAAVHAALVVWLMYSLSSLREGSITELIDLLSGVDSQLQDRLGLR